LYPEFDGTQPCASIDPELFFPEENANAIMTARKVAQDICGSCEQIEKCLEYALHNDVTGIWAGTYDTDRKEIRKKRGIKNVNYMYLTIDKLTR
jgi:WhiB family redox-sensing transcriptional regulator